MKRRVRNSGLRAHRPKKPFRFEYVGALYRAFPKGERPFWRALDEAEKEQDGYLDLVGRYGRHKGGRGGGEGE